MYQVRIKDKEKVLVITTIGSRIREIRQENELTQLELANKLHVTASCISKIEKDKEKPSDMLIKLMSYEFNIPFHFIKEGLYNGNSVTEIKSECANKDIESNSTMKSEHINGIVNILHESVLYKLERDNIAYKEYLQEESELINCIASLNISEVTRDYLNDKYYTLVSRLDYLMFVAGLRASKEITGILCDDNLDKVLI